MLPTKLGFIGQTISVEKNIKKSANQKQESHVAAMFANESGRNEQLPQSTIPRCFLPSFGSVGQAVSEEQIVKYRPIRNKNCLWRPCLFMDLDEMSNLYRGHSIDASYQDSVHLAEGFQRHISVIQFRYLYRDNCILNIFKQELSFF